MKATKPRKKPAYTCVTGTCCWFIDEFGRWYLCRVVGQGNGKVTLQSETGTDAERLVPWPHTDGIEISKYSPLFKRLRPLSARRP